MQHDTKKINSFIQYAGKYREGAPYLEILNSWMEETGERLSGTEELRYYIGLIPMALKRGQMRENAKRARECGR